MTVVLRSLSILRVPMGSLKPQKYLNLKIKFIKTLKVLKSQVFLDVLGSLSLFRVLLGPSTILVHRRTDWNMNSTVQGQSGLS